MRGSRSGGKENDGSQIVVDRNTMYEFVSK